MPSFLDALPRVATVTILLLCLGACSSPEAVRTPVPVEVRVPVPTEAPAPPQPTRPALPIAGIDSTSSAQQVTRAYVASLVLLQAYARQLERILGAYREGSRSEGPARADSAGVGGAHR